MQTIDTFTPLKAAGLGALLAGPNPKNLLLTIAAGATIAQAGISAGEQVIVFAIFALIATLGPGSLWGSTRRSATAPQTFCRSCERGWCETIRRS